MAPLALRKLKVTTYKSIIVLPVVLYGFILVSQLDGGAEVWSVQELKWYNIVYVGFRACQHHGRLVS